jgi:hypothetical protein
LKHLILFFFLLGSQVLLANSDSVAVFPLQKSQEKPFKILKHFTTTTYYFNNNAKLEFGIGELKRGLTNNISDENLAFSIYFVRASVIFSSNFERTLKFIVASKQRIYLLHLSILI